jgi:hypothetical protein
LLRCCVEWNMSFTFLSRHTDSSSPPVRLVTLTTSNSDNFYISNAVRGTLTPFHHPEKRQKEKSENLQFNVFLMFSVFVLIAISEIHKGGVTNGVEAQKDPFTHLNTHLMPCSLRASEKYYEYSLGSGLKTQNIYERKKDKLTFLGISKC